MVPWNNLSLLLTESHTLICLFKFYNNVMIMILQQTSTSSHDFINSKPELTKCNRKQ
jgi:hypothetical protein